jgi:hypothetical protein
MDQVAMNLQGVAQHPDMMQQVIPAAEYIGSSREFSKQSATWFVLITSKLDMERKITRQNC